MYIGIDLGTTNSAMANVEDGDPKIITNSDGHRTTPSVVKLGEGENDVVVGRTARNDLIRKPDRTLARTKQDMGEDVTYEVDGTDYPPQRIGSYILQRFQEDAFDATGEDVEAAVITVPAYFGEAAREATRTAASFADLDVLRVMNEPTAACYAYGYDQEDGGEQTVLVYDLGGGTFDATIVTIGEDIIEVKGTGGDKQLGGEEFTDDLFEHVKDYFVGEGAERLEETEYKLNQLRQDVKRAKHELTNDDSTVVTYDTGAELLELEVTRKKFNDIVSDRVDTTIECIDDLFENDDIDAAEEDIDNILLVGGATRMPIISERIQDEYGMEPALDANPDEIVAEGAALEAASYETLPGEGDEEGDTTVTIDVLSHGLGVEVGNPNGANRFDLLFSSQSQVPDDASKGYTNPDEAETIIVRVLQEAENVDELSEEEQKRAENAKALGEFLLSGLPPKPRGTLDIQVDFHVDEEGLLTASAEVMNDDIDEAGEIEIDDAIGLTEKEIEDIKDETKQYPVERDDGDDDDDEDENQ